MTVLFCNIDWMTYYNGEEENSPYSHYHFQDYNGCCYGSMDVVPQIGTDTLEDVYVIWVSHDEYQEEPVIVGWYKNATIYRHEQIEHDKYSIGRELRYCAKAKSSDCLLLPLTERNFVVQEASKSDAAFLSMLLDYIDGCTIPPLNQIFTEQVLSAVLKDPGLNYDELMEAGDHAINEGAYYKALVYFNTAFHKNKNIDAIFNIASMLETLCCFDQAIPVFEKLRELEGDEQDTLDNLLDLYLQTGRYEQALEICMLSLDQAEDEEEVCSLLCVQTDIYTQLGQLDKAIACLDFILENSTDELMKQEAHSCKHQLLHTDCDCHHHHDCGCCD